MRPSSLALGFALLATLAAGGIAHAGEQPSPPADAADPQPSLPHDLDGELRRVQLLRAKGDYAAAIKSVAQLMLVAPDDPRVVGEYGKALVQAGRGGEAADFLKRAIQLQTGNWTLYSALGVAEDQIGQVKLAGQSYRQALQIQPGEPSVLNNLALSLMRTGNLAEAETLLREAQAKGSGDPRIAGNLKRIAEERAKFAPVPAAPESHVIVPMPVAAKPLPANHDDATSAPRPLVAPRVTQDPAGAPVMMAKVPFDPLAGKHYPVKPEPAHRLAAVASNPAKPAAQLAGEDAAKKPADNAPVLRTAADVF